MSDAPRLWMRHETRSTERRAPLTPEDAATLVAHGIPVTVEESPQRVFPLGDYRASGCATAPAGAWTAAPADVHVIGLKELPGEPGRLTHRHIFFGHAYKGQTGARELLDRFAAGGGTLLDLEYLTDEDGRRLAAFGYWAGYVGAALAVLHHRGRLAAPLVPLGRSELDAALRNSRTGDGPRALVTGALGRCGAGARDALATAGIEPTCWDLAETRSLDRPALLDHDLLVNAVLTSRPVPPFLTAGHLETPGRRLSVVSDVTCDVTSDCNVLPFNDRTTGWEHPARRLLDGDGGAVSGDGTSGVRPLDVIAIDNLPSLLPAEASRSFSADLLPHLLDLGGPPWERCRRTFHAALESAHV